VYYYLSIILLPFHKVLSSEKNNYNEAVLFFKEKEVSGVISAIIDFNNEDAFDKMLDNNRISEYKDSIGMWLADYGYYLYKIGSLQECIKITSNINEVVPQNSWAFFIRADATYDSGNPIEAKRYYGKFIELMKEKGDEKLIPKRVIERAQ
jgi:tetratricopeptide (TPR) repeat protein